MLSPVSFPDANRAVQAGMISVNEPFFQGARMSAGCSGSGCGFGVGAGAGRKGSFFSAIGLPQGMKPWLAGWNSHNVTNSSRPMACGQTIQAIRYQRSSYQSLPWAASQDPEPDPLFA